MSELPRALEEAMTCLESSGFAVVSQERSESFDNRTIELSNGPTLARFVADRGQWFIEVKHETWDDWFEPDLWRSWLQGSHPQTEPRTLAEQASILREDLDQICDGARKEPDRIHRELQRLRDDRAKERLNFS